MRSTWTAAVLLVTTLGGAAPASAQFTSHTYDITRYDLEVRPDFSTGELRVDAQVAIRNLRHEPSFSFGLSTQYDTVTATVDGRDVEVRRSGGVIEIAAPPTTAAVQVRFALHGHSIHSEDENRAVIDRDSLFLLWSDRFYPIDFADWAAVKTSVLLPPGMPAIAPGVLKSTRPTTEGVWHVFETAHPVVSFSVFADRRWIRTERTAGPVKMITLLHPEAQRFADDLFRTSGDVLTYYTQLHGYYPANQFAFVTLTGMYARRAFPDFVGYEPKYLEQTMARDGYDGHETALLWWGYATRGEGPGSFQWTEGFGDYMEMLYAEARNKPVPYNLQRARTAFLAMNPAPDLALTDLKGNTPQPLIHGRLPWMMDSLRRTLADEAFRRGVRALFKAYRYRTFTLDQFISVFESVARPDVRPSVRKVFFPAAPEKDLPQLFEPIVALRADGDKRPAATRIPRRERPLPFPPFRWSSVLVRSGRR